ncbi:MAG: hypothetical protein AAF571_06105 [Verrucomicrobiota bacterium]
MKKVFYAYFIVGALVCIESPTEAKIVDSFVHKFSAGAQIQKEQFEYGLNDTDKVIFTLVTDPEAQDSPIYDGPGDGVAVLRKGQPVTHTCKVYINLGKIDALDVGKTVQVDAIFRHSVAQITNWSLQLDREPIGGYGESSRLSVSTYTGSGIQHQHGVYHQLSQLSGVCEKNTNQGRVAGPLTHAIGAADVGKVLGFEFWLYEKGSQMQKALYLDTLAFTVVDEANSGKSYATKLHEYYLSSRFLLIWGGGS